ncbi:hypothetical protein [Streptomyces sp. NPDC016675]|uniref:AMP-binding enzyme n=1 Tax=Streptomyces sp. NPDC016675 TaxID=3364970 RepID=UPI0036FA9EA5
MTDRQKDVTPRTPVAAPAPPGHRPSLSTVWADAPLDGRACVVGVPDERWGEAVKAVVVPHPGGAAVTAAEPAGYERERGITPATRPTRADLEPVTTERTPPPSPRASAPPGRRTGGSDGR